MKRFFALALVLGSFVPCGLTGCSDEAKDKTVETKTGPSGTKETTTETKVKTTGDEKPSETKP